MPTPPRSVDPDLAEQIAENYEEQRRQQELNDLEDRISDLEDELGCSAYRC